MTTTAPPSLTTISGFKDLLLMVQAASSACEDLHLMRFEESEMDQEQPTRKSLRVDCFEPFGHLACINAVFVFRPDGLTEISRKGRRVGAETPWAEGMRQLLRHLQDSLVDATSLTQASIIRLDALFRRN